MPACTYAPSPGSSPGNTVIIRRSATKTQARGFLFPLLLQSQQWKNTKDLDLREQSSKNTVFYNLGERKLQRNKLNVGCDFFF